jgi:hypothetical protein
VRLSALVESSDGALRPVRELTTDPDVTAVVTTDLLEPGRYLDGGELVLTGLVWWRRDQPERAGTFVTALVQAGAVALAAGEAELGLVPEELVEACEAAGLPLLRVPIAYSFAAVTDRATRALSGRDDLAGVLARHRALVAAAAGGSGLSDLLVLVSGFVRARCWVLGPAGRVIDGPRDAALEDRVALARQFIRAPHVPWVVARPAGMVTVFGERPGWFLAVEADHRNLGGEHRAAIAELAGLVAVEHGIALRRSDAERRLAVALTGTDPGAVVDALAGCGLDPGQPAVVVVGTGAAAPAVLAEALASLPGQPRWALGPGAEAVVAGGDPTGPLRAFLAAVEPGLGPEPVRIGVSDPVTGGAGLLAALAEARSALAAAGPGTGVVGPERLSSHDALLVAVPADLRRAYHRRVLGPLVAHDEAHRTDLVHTLAAYLECSGSWSRCAALMHVHVNTLRYRIEKIEALTGRDLRRLSDQVDLLLALRALAPEAVQG